MRNGLDQRGSARPAGRHPGPGQKPTTPTPYARTVLDAVDRIPPGRVMTYGDVAEFCGRGSGRSVGAVLHRHGAEVAWWRVVQASGRPAEPHRTAALARLAGEGCPLVGERVMLAHARWDGRPDP